MITIYLDHNIAHYFVRGFPNGDADRTLVEESALATAIERYPHVRFVVSGWSIVEAAAEREASGPPVQLADRYADFYERLIPLHIAAADVVEREEMKRCAYLVLGLISTSTDIPVFCQYLSEVLTMAGIEPLLGYDLRKELRYFARDPGRRKIFQQANQDALKARQDILKAKQQGRDSDPQIQRQVLRAWFGSLIPLRGPDGRVLSVSDRERVLELFVESPEQVFNTSPAILAEDVLTGVRASMGNRRPRLQDGMDLMHAILPLAYCDAFISNDGNVRDGAKRTLKATRRDVVVEARLSEALNKLPL